EGSLGERNRRRDREAGPAKDGLGGKLVEGEATRIKAPSGIGNPEKLEKRRDRPVFPEPAMKGEEGDVELAGTEGLDQLLVGVQFPDPVAPIAQGLGHPLA